MYCDIDVLIIKPLTLFIDKLKPSTIYIQKEGALSNPNYGAAFTKKELDSITGVPSGFSAGKYFIYGKQLYDVFMGTVCALFSKDPTLYYTIEQPFFNKALYCLNTLEHTIDFTLLHSPIVSVNLHSYSKDTTLFIDAMGIPGDGEFHFEKILNTYIMIQSESLDLMFHTIKN